MKKGRLLSTILILALIMSFIIVPSCGNEEQAKKEDDVIKIGAILPLTGNLSYLGQEEKNVLTIFENKNKEQKIDIIFEDSKGTAKDGLMAYERLKSRGVNYFITSLTIVAEAIKPKLKSNEIQMALSVHPDITDSSNQTYCIYYNLKQEMKLISDYLQDQNAKNIGALYINTPESNIVIENYLSEYLNKRNMNLSSVETFNFTDKSFKNQLLKLKNDNVDYVITIDFGYNYPKILKESQNLGIKNKIIGGLGMMTSPPMSNELKSGLIFATSSFIVNPSEDYEELKREYVDLFDLNLTFDGVYTYDSAIYLLNLITQNKTPQILNGISGKIVMENQRAAVEILLVKYNEDGTIRIINENKAERK